MLRGALLFPATCYNANKASLRSSGDTGDTLCTRLCGKDDLRIALPTTVRRIEALVGHKQIHPSPVDLLC